MQELKDRIVKEGKVLPGNIIKVDGFLNHRIDTELMTHIAEEFGKHFNMDEVTMIPVSYTHLDVYKRQRYEGVVLDRQFRLSAEITGDGVYRDAQLLSAGALDQLYLAVRLAICQLVLPPEREVPMVLDLSLIHI